MQHRCPASPSATNECEYDTNEPCRVVLGGEWWGDLWPASLGLLAVQDDHGHFYGTMGVRIIGMVLGGAVAGILSSMGMGGDGRSRWNFGWRTTGRQQEEQVDEQSLLVPAALRAAVSVGTAYRPCL
jgi:hypothetical protein